MTEERAYIDSSAYMGLLLNKGPLREMQEVLHNHIPCSSILLVIESERNLVRLSREQQLSLDAFQSAFDTLRRDTGYYLLKEFSLNLCLTGVFPPVQMPKSSDLAHLRTALWFRDNGGLSSFLTLDLRQRRAAKELGLPVAELS